LKPVDRAANIDSYERLLDNPIVSQSSINPHNKAERNATVNALMKWNGDLSFVGSADTGFSVPLGAEPEVGGHDDGFRPLELVLVGLAGCTAMDVISILEKKRQKVTEFEVRAHAERAQEHPKVFTAITVEYIVTGEGVSEEAVQRAIELSETKYCPAQAMLSKSAPIKHVYEIRAA
jgi:putative redox protein